MSKKGAKEEQKKRRTFSWFRSSESEDADGGEGGPTLDPRDFDHVSLGKGGPSAPARPAQSTSAGSAYAATSSRQARDEEEYSLRFTHDGGNGHADARAAADAYDEPEARPSILFL